MNQVEQSVFLRNVENLDPLAIQLGHQLWHRRSTKNHRPLTQIAIARELVGKSFHQAGRPLDPMLIDGEAQRITELLRRYRKKGWYQMPSEFCRQSVSEMGPAPDDGVFLRPTESLDRLAVELGYRLWTIASGADNHVPSQVSVAREVVRSASVDEAATSGEKEINHAAYRIVDLLKAYRLRGWYQMPAAFRAR